MHQRLAQLARSVAVVVVLALGAGAGAAHAPTAEEDTTVTWGLRPAHVEPHAPDRPNFAYTASPGETVDDALVVSNYSAEDLALTVYAADAFTNSRGVLDVRLPGEPAVSVGAWVEVGADDVVVPAGGAVEVPLTLRVPHDAEPGDHAGGIVTSLLSQNDAGVSTDRRLGSRIHVRVDGEVAPVLVADGAQVAYAGTVNPVGAGSARLQVDVANRGNVRISGEAAVRVSGPFGLGASEAVAEVPELLPGESLTVTVELADVLPLVVLFADVRLTGTVPADGTEVDVVVVTASTAAIPWTLLVLVALLVGLVCVARWRSRRRAEQTARLIEEAVAAARGEAAAEGAPTALPGKSQPPGSPLVDQGDPGAVVGGAR